MAATERLDRLPARSAEIPRWINFLHSNRDLATRLAQVLEELGVRKALLVSGPTARSLLGRSLLIDVGAHVKMTGAEVTGASLGEAAGLRDAVVSTPHDAVIGVGGGKTLDLAKYAAFQAGVPFVAIPTQASHDGIASPVAVLADGENRAVDSHGARPPTALLVPIHLIAQAPRRTIASGVGDLAANSLAVADWRWASDCHDEPFDDYAALLGMSAADLMIARRDAYDPYEPFEAEDVEVLVHGLLLSGLAMTVGGSSRPCSGPEHLISHAFDRLELGSGLHGEQVAVGVVLAARLYDQSFEKVLRLLRNVGAPTRPEDIGISMDEALRALLVVPNVRPNRRSRLTEALRADPEYVTEQAREAWAGSS